jgi:antitoxin component of MazEF toxin-antitoxin module
MIEMKGKLRKWGNSFGIVVPQRVVEKEHVEVGDDLTILITKIKKPDLRKLFGTHKFSKPVEQLMRESDEELYYE